MALRYQPILSRTIPDYPLPSPPIPCTFPCHPVLFSTHPTHCPCTKNCPLSCTYHSMQVHALYTVDPILNYVPSQHPLSCQPVVSSFRRFVDPVNLSRPLTSYVVSLGPIGSPLLNYHVTTLTMILVIYMRGSNQQKYLHYSNYPNLPYSSSASPPPRCGLADDGFVDCPSPLSTAPPSFSPFSSLLSSPPA